ncbi:histidine kinase [Tessaracoccus sp. OS52]|uniref:sensor histidine kinase n=1 Tax=Tessaracoccus sp. OS52 TaxID=2886691 RepID=UPI001D126578|nr:histidine kinase [Tessaracoccus sp. OS52]MCC2592239.1 histidine kinase [Tessaracoccus sp. OS52]
MSLRQLRGGWVEVVVATLLTALSLQAGFTGRIPWESVALDIGALAAVLLALRWLRVGIAAALVVTVLALLFDPVGLGLSSYLCMLPALTAIRRDKIPLAVIVTAINVGVGWVTSFRLAGADADPLAIILTWLILYAIIWGIGLGMRAASRNELARLAARYRRQQLELAMDLHDSVCRDLSLLVMQAEAVNHAGEATPGQLEALAERARSANQAVREVARLLGGANRNTVPEVKLESSLKSGTHELRSLGFNVQARAALVGELPPVVDTAAGRILQEALHNVAKHGSAQAPCLVTVERTADALEMAVSNLPGRGGTGSGTRLGLRAMRERAATVGGTVRSKEVDGMWICEVTLPIGSRATSRAS